MFKTLRLCRQPRADSHSGALLHTAALLVRKCQNKIRKLIKCYALICTIAQTLLNVVEASRLLHLAVYYLPELGVCQWNPERVK